MRITRRAFLGTTTASILGTCFGLFRWFGDAAADSGLPRPVIPNSYAYLTQSEVAFLDAAVERLIPADNLGAGAREAGVTFFIDRQLAGTFGRAETWYMRGPFQKGTKQQGYQSQYTPAELYRRAIADIDAHCRRTYGNRNFAALPPNTQDEVLHAIDDGKVELQSVSAKTFFDMLVQNTKEGFLADPIYGGNRNFAGWKMIGFPGPRYNYVDTIEQYGRRYALPTIGLLGRDGMRHG